MGLYEDLIQNHDAKLIAGGAAQNTARGAQVWGFLFAVGDIAERHHRSRYMSFFSDGGKITDSENRGSTYFLIIQWLISAVLGPINMPTF